MSSLSPLARQEDPFKFHLERLRAMTTEGHSLESVPRWIQENTFLRGEPYSFKDHEFQLKVLQDPSRERIVRKCSQIGLSETAVRMALATLSILDSVTVIFTLPTATAAKLFSKTRFDPIVQSSPALRAAINPTADNTEIKQLGSSFLYLKGTVNAGAAISIPADFIVSDELDFSDPEVVSNYHSRLTHSPHKLKVSFSTPTTEGYGISAAFADSRQHWNIIKCSCCAQHFIPDYFKHVRVPGFLGDLREITRETLPTVRFEEAFVECPHCGGKPSLQVEHREWVVANCDTKYIAAGYQVQPFDAPNIISCSDLIQSSTRYSRYTDFVNFGLGLPAEDSESTLSRSELLSCFIREGAPGFYTHVLGADMGMICHLMVAGVDPYGRMLVVHSEQVPLGKFRERKEELCRQYRVALMVMDALPYTETALALQATDPNLYGAIYTRSKDLIPYRVKMTDEETTKEGEQVLRQVNISRTLGFDMLVGAIRAGRWLALDSPLKEMIISHLCDQKRVRDISSEGESNFIWRKGTGADHFAHAALYTYIAAQMRGVSGGGLILPVGVLGKFKHSS